MSLLPFLAVAVIALGVYKFYFQPVYFTPLSKVPSAHWICSFSQAWLLWQKWTKQENAKVYDAHMKHGTAVRLSPNLISINTFDDGLKTIYQGGFPKPDFYWHGFAVYNKPNLFTIKDNATHSSQKRMLSHSFSKSNILSSESIRTATKDVLFGRVLPLLQDIARRGQSIEVIELNYSYFLDTFVQWQFGKSLGSNLVENETERRMYLDGFFGIAEYTFWQYNFPNLTAWLAKIGIHLIPKSVWGGFAKVEDWNLMKCDSAYDLLRKSGLSSGDRPCVFEQALKGMSDLKSGSSSYPNRLELASDMFSLNSGAFETSGNTTTYLMYELSRNPVWQTRLREELRGLKFPVGQPNEITDPRALDQLPVLHAIVQETMRRWPSVPGGQPRLVPKQCDLAGYLNIPAGTVVQAYAGTLHRTPEVFPDPWTWKPERWLDADPEQLVMMKRYSWGFGSGSRGCLGNHFALYGELHLR